MKASVLLFLLISFYGQAQQITGKVIDSLSGKPLAGASVFISNTSIGTITNDSGIFALNKIAFSRFDLVISYVGYKTLVINDPTVDQPAFLVRLQRKNNTLQDVIVRNYEKNGWEKWGFLFTNLFIGTTALADQCKILNPKDIGFVYSKSKQLLDAYASTPIIIVNKKLGYTIEFDLEDFSYDFKSKLLLFTGYPLFKELRGNNSQRKKWTAQRTETYSGSLLQFMRGVFRNNFKEDGFVVRRLVRTSNLEKQRVKMIVAHQPNINLMPPDSMNYYTRVMRQKDYQDYLYTKPLDFKDFAYKTDSSSVRMSFKDCLHVTYPKKKEAPEYYLRNIGIYPDSCITSILTLQQNSQIIIDFSGSFYEAENLITMAYWGWSEKVSTMLPLDYWP
jgi:hypothetical protein